MNKNFKGQTFLVTGGAGFIGSYVVEKLLPLEPKKILIIDNLLRGSHENMALFANNPIVDFVEGDIRNTALVDSLVAKSDYCFHMAALRINACAADPNEAFDVMIKSTFDFVESCKKHKIKKVIYSSSASVYGLAQHFPTPESDNPYDNRTFYGTAKTFGEGLFRSYNHMFQLPYVGLRYFNVYGPRMDTHGKYTEVMIKWLDCIRDSKNPIVNGDGSTSMDFIDVRDVARANIQALISDANDQVFNVGFGRETSLKKLLLALLKVNNKESLTPIHTAASTINPVARRLADIETAKSQLGFKAEITLEQGLLDLSKWYFSKAQKA